MTICCGDSHTSTHGAFGAIAFGIGTSQVRDVLATQTLAMDKLKVRRIEVTGKLRPGVYAKDVTLHVIGKLGVNGGVGYAYEYGGRGHRSHDDGRAHDPLQHEHRGRRALRLREPGRDDVSPTSKGREFAPKGAAWERAVAYWDSVRSDADAAYDDVVTIRGEDIEPVVTWGITPGQSIGVNGTIPAADDFPRERARDRRRGVRVHVARSRGRRSAGRRSTSRSSDRARTGGSRISRRCCGSSRARGSR